MASRADRIFDILNSSREKRLSVSNILKKLAKAEGFAEKDFYSAMISACVRNDNTTKTGSGKIKRFNIFGDGTEARGYISLYNTTRTKNISDIIANYEAAIPQLIEKANDEIRGKLKESLANFEWRSFETNFLPQILETLGFHDIQITQATRDGGKDAVCNYQRGIVKSEAIVSAKCWNIKQTVGVSEVQRLRGIRGNADSAIIITTAKFSPDAIKEAEPSQNHRSIVLIDCDTIVDICMEKNLGLSEVKIPRLYKFTGFDPSSGDDEA